MRYFVESDFVVIKTILEAAGDVDQHDLSLAWLRVPLTKLVSKVEDACLIE